MKTNALITYTIRLVLVYAVYLLTLFFINSLDLHAYTLWQRTALSALPVLPAIAIIPVVLGFIRQMDEVWQRIITEAGLISAGIVGIGTFTLGFIEHAVDLPNGLMIWVWPTMIIIHALCMPFVQRRYA